MVLSKHFTIPDNNFSNEILQFFQILIMVNIVMKDELDI